jgi:hypothetical protein
MLLFGLLALGAGGAWAGAKETSRVAGIAVLESSVCGGGAAISREQIERLPPPRPVAGKEFLVVAGDRINVKRPVARFTTRIDGTFATRLPAGTWCIFEAARRPAGDEAPPVAAPEPGIDEACLAENRRRCDLVLPVTSDVRAARIVFVERCPQPWAQPCYHGPMPP